MQRRTLLLFVVPALVFYVTFVVYPLGQAVHYSFLDWDGIGPATSAGWSNYTTVLTDPELRASLVHAFELIIFFSLIPVLVGLVAASLIRELRAGAFNTSARVVLFLPQVMPLVAAAICWQWLYSDDGFINSTLRHLGLTRLTQPWLGNFTTALPAVGLIGSWMALGFCTVLFLAGIGNIPPSLYEAARIDGAGRFAEFRAVTLPGLRRQISVAATITTISALSSFDLIFIATNGGPGYQTEVPALEIYRLTFSSQQVGPASALGVLLACLVLLVVRVIQWVARSEDHT